MRRRVAPLVLAAWLLAGCGTDRGSKHVGDPCSDASECRHGLCVEGVGGDEAVCTRSCASARDCPRGWACAGVTNNNVLVCTRGSPTPFGIGMNEGTTD